MRKAANVRPTTLEQACGQIIANTRDHKGLSQMDLAVASGYSLRYIGDIERGSKSPTLRTMNDLATLLELNLSELLSQAERLLNRKERRNSAVQRPQQR